MRSVIDEIAAAEQRADEIRVAGAAEAREMTQQARDGAKTALSELEHTQREATQAQLELARIEGERLSAELLTQMEHESDALCARAEGKLTQAVAYLLDKVTKTA